MPPRLARLLATLAALALVAGAFALRGVLAGDGSEPAGDGPGPAADGTPYRVLCDDDLGAACDVLADLEGVGAVQILRASDAVADLTAEGGPAADAWLTLDPWPQMLASASDPTRPVAATDVVPVASAPLAVLADPATFNCPDDPVAWDCLSTPTRPAVGVADPSTATGALILAHAAAGLHGSADDLALNTLDPEVRSTLVTLVAPSAPPVAAQALAITQPGRFSAVVTPRGRGEAVATTAQGRALGLTVVALEPAATLGVVLVGIGPRGPAALEALVAPVTGQTVGDALAGEGWTGPAQRSTGLPAHDVIYALQEELA